MDQLRDLADNRLLHGCIYCGEPDADTKDHVPSRVLLDRPYPENLPAVPACLRCNNGFSRDEEYVVSLLECAIAGSTDPDKLRRSSVADILRRSPALRARIEAAKSVVDGGVVFTAEDARVENVIRKLARGHAAFELSLPLRCEPTSVTWRCLSLMSKEEREAYDAPHLIQVLGEIGSRGSRRELVTQLLLQSPTGELLTLNMLINNWIDVQEGRYRYLAVDDTEGASIRMVIAEFLACEVSWRDDESG